MSRSLLNKRHSEHGAKRLKASCQKDLKSHDPVDSKSTKSKKLPSVQNLDLDFFSLSQTKRERILNVKRDLAMLNSPHDDQDSKVMISLQVNNSNISLKRDVSKSNIDTAIDFVKIFKKQHPLENYSEK